MTTDLARFLDETPTEEEVMASNAIVDVPQSAMFLSVWQAQNRVKIAWQMAEWMKKELLNISGPMTYAKDSAFQVGQPVDFHVSYGIRMDMCERLIKEIDQARAAKGTE